MKYLPFLLILFSSCNYTLTEVYYKQAVDIGYIEVDNRIDWIEDRRVEHLQYKLNIDTVIHEIYSMRKVYRNGNLKKIIPIRRSYIPINYNHINQVNKKGRVIIKNKLRNNIKYHIE